MPAACSYSEPDKSSSFPSHILKIYFNIIFPSKPRSSKWFLTFMSSHQNPVCTCTDCEDDSFSLLDNLHSFLKTSYISSWSYNGETTDSIPNVVHVGSTAGSVCSCPRRQVPGGGKMNISNGKIWFPMLNKYQIINTDKKKCYRFLWFLC